MRRRALVAMRKAEELRTREELASLGPYACPKCMTIFRRGLRMHIKFCKGNGNVR